MYRNQAKSANIFLEQEKDLTDIVFTTQQVADSDEHRLLMALRETELKDEEVTTAFYEKITSSLALDTPYMILLAYDKYTS